MSRPVKVSVGAIVEVNAICSVSYKFWSCLRHQEKPGSRTPENSTSTNRDKLNP